MNSTDNFSNDPWSKEQAPFAGAKTPAEVSAAAEEAAAAPESQQGSSTAASAGAVPAAGGATPGYGASGTYGATVTTGTAGTAGASGIPNPGSPAGWGPVNGAYGAAPPPGVVAVQAGEPSPALGFFLGLIPGVGAMYNGQVVKGFIHLVVFAVLVSLADNVNGIFGLFVAGWIAFMAFEAYHTAKARRDGLPLPNPFGWNDIGDRFGLGRNWFNPGAPTGVPPAGSANAQGPAGAPGATGWTTPPPPPAGATPYPAPYPGAVPYAVPVAPNWAGYVPPSAFAGAPPVGSAPGAMGGTAVPLGGPVPYAPVSTGTPYMAADVVPPSSKLPAGALWLIGLGLLFLIGQWTPLLRWSHVWVPSILLAGFAIFLFARRMGWTGSPTAASMALLSPGLRAAVALRTPGALLAIAVLNALHEASVVRWYRSWPVLLIVVGLLMLLERAALRQAAPLDPVNDPVAGGVQ